MRQVKREKEIVFGDKVKVLLVYRFYTSSFISYPWVFARGGNVIVDTISPKGHLVNHSVWVNERIEVRECDDFMERLCATLKSGDYDELLCIDEPSRTLVLEGFDQPELKPYLPFTQDSPLHQAAINKSYFYEWCTSVGLDTPKSISCLGKESVRDTAAAFGFPCVLKAAEGAGGMDVNIIHRANELEAALNSKGDETEWIVQEYVDGPVGTSIFMAYDGKLYAHCSFENIACTSGGVGPSCVCRHLDSSEPLDSIVATVAEHVNGLTGFDWMVRKDGSYVLIDPHFGRVAPTGVSAHLVGVDFGRAYYGSYFGQMSPSSYRKLCSVIWIFPQMLKLVCDRNLMRVWRHENPFRRHVRCFFFGAGEWRIFIRQLTDYFVSQAQISGGRLKNVFRRSSKS